jgi:hypothetical protein
MGYTAATITLACLSTLFIWVSVLARKNENAAHHFHWTCKGASKSKTRPTFGPTDFLRVKPDLPPKKWTGLSCF